MIVEYESKSTPMHRLDPRAKFAWMLAAIVISVIWTNPIYLVGLCVAIIGFGFLAEFPWAKVKGVLSFILVITAIITLVQGATYVPKTVTIADPTRVLFHIIPGWIPGIGPAGAVRIGGFLYGIGMALKVSVVLVVVAIFGYLTSPSEIVQIIARVPFVPYQVGFVMSTAWKFIPVVQTQMRTLMDAHRSRGVDFEQGTLTQKVRKTSNVVFPLFANALSMADTMALAMESRAFGCSKKFTFIRPYRMTLADRLALWGSIFAMIASIVCLAVWKMGAL
ncbi:MAG: energy-coupling factor transporter transmembrane component T [Clostridia bacterium]|nr:energy-coupling factor transporter transmembrane component T [Clostridia bacterium]